MYIARLISNFVTYFYYLIYALFQNYYIDITVL